MAKRRRDSDHEEVRRERLAYVGALAAGLVHEVRTPLHAIQLNAQMLVEDAARLSPDLRDRFERRAQRVYAEVKNLTRTLDAFLAFARPPRLDPVPTDLNRFVRDLLDFAGPELDEAGICVEADLADDMYPVVLDQGQFTHAMLNLLRNAREAITLRRETNAEPFEPLIRVSTAETGDAITLAVEDNGVGIAPEAEDRIFDVFFTTKPKGTGLGLGIVRRIVEDHRGTIRVEPMAPPAVGARFVVTLPRGRFLEFQPVNPLSP